jgi:hypothetical protein
MILYRTKYYAINQYNSASESWLFKIDEMKKSFIKPPKWSIDLCDKIEEYRVKNNHYPDDAKFKELYIECSPTVQGIITQAERTADEKVRDHFWKYEGIDKRDVEDIIKDFNAFEQKAKTEITSKEYRDLEQILSKGNSTLREKEEFLRELSKRYPNLAADFQIIEKKLDKANDVIIENNKIKEGLLGGITQDSIYSGGINKDVLISNDLLLKGKSNGGYFIDLKDNKAELGRYLKFREIIQEDLEKNVNKDSESLKRFLNDFNLALGNKANVKDILKNPAVIKQTTNFDKLQAALEIMGSNIEDASHARIQHLIKSHKVDSLGDLIMVIGRDPKADGFSKNEIQELVKVVDSKAAENIARKVSPITQSRIAQTIQQMGATPPIVTGTGAGSNPNTGSGSGSNTGSGGGSRSTGSGSGSTGSSNKGGGKKITWGEKAKTWVKDHPWKTTGLAALSLALGFAVWRSMKAENDGADDSQNDYINYNKFDRYKKRFE